jgi:hypothetical protein
VININRGPEPEFDEPLTAPPEFGEEESGATDPPSPQPTKVRTSNEKLDAFRLAFMNVTGGTPKRLALFPMDGLLS